MKLLLSTVERRKKSAYCLYSTWFIVNVFSAIFVCDIHICIALSFLLLFSSQNWTQSSHQKKYVIELSSRFLQRKFRQQVNTHIVPHIIDSSWHFVNASELVRFFFRWSLSRIHLKLTALTDYVHHSCIFSAYWQ